MRTLLILLLSTVSALAQPVFPPAFWAPSVSSAIPLIVNETFESGVNPGWNFIAGAGTKNFNDTTNVLAGSVSLALDGTSATAGAFTNYTGASEVFASFLFKAPLPPAASSRAFCSFGSASPGTNFVIISLFDTGVVRMQTATGSTADLTTHMADQTLYYCWLHYKAGSGANAVIDFEFQTTNTRVGSGNNFKQLTNASGVENAANFLAKAVTPTFWCIIDNVKVSTVNYPTQ